MRVRLIWHAPIISLSLHIRHYLQPYRRVAVWTGHSLRRETLALESLDILDDPLLDEAPDRSRIRNMYTYNRNRMLTLYRNM